MDNDNVPKKPARRSKNAKIKQMLDGVAITKKLGRKTTKTGNPGWAPGQSGNPAGRPKGSINYRNRIQNVFLQLMEHPVSDMHGKKSPFLEVFLQGFINQAIAGDRDATKFLMDRLVSSDVIDSIDAYINRGRREDTYFLSYQLYKDAFDQQQLVLMSHKSRILMMTGRRGGKTEALQRKIVDTLVIREGCQVVYVARTMTIGMDQIWQGTLDLLKSIGAKVEEHRRAEGKLRLENGSELFVWSNTDKTSRENLRGLQLGLSDRG